MANFKNASAGALLTIFSMVGGAVSSYVAFQDIVVPARDTLMAKFNIESNGQKSNGIPALIGGGAAGIYLARRKNRNTSDGAQPVIPPSRPR